MIEKDLRQRIVDVEESQTLTIFMRFKPTGWARFNIDGQLGALAIQSDWGDWQHVWGGGPSSWGHPTFIDFLKDRAGCHYLTDKLHYGGRTREVIAGKETRKEMLGRLLRARLEGDLDKYDAREMWDAVDHFINSIEGKPWSDTVWMEWKSACDTCSKLNDFYDTVHELIGTEPHPRLVFLRDQLLPIMVAHLRGELRVEQPAAP